jgi:hypothetical protein
MATELCTVGFNGERRVRRLAAEDVASKGIRKDTKQNDNFIVSLAEGLAERTQSHFSR